MKSLEIGGWQRNGQKGLGSREPPAVTLRPAVPSRTLSCATPAKPACTASILRVSSLPLTRPALFALLAAHARCAAPLGSDLLSGPPNNRFFVESSISYLTSAFSYVYPPAAPLPFYSLPGHPMNPTDNCPTCLPTQS